MTTAVAAPFRFFSLQVVRTERLGPSLVRVSFAGDDLRSFHSAGRDQSLSLFLPHPGQDAPAIPYEPGDGWWQAWRELPDDVRAVMRSYTCGNSGPTCAATPSRSMSTSCCTG